ncbi:LysR family transcriptional regulator [Pseudovibrio ascidiaceicola]|uniref:LysR family transcriptional regulator n=1 Tax=Pseudovibrio ascidiaceicola TaxID=285279 RepID=UPI000D69D86E|nr:LysR family transcriptional regulator [Pseudovibrio ascidiaceicola]
MSDRKVNLLGRLPSLRAFEATVRCGNIAAAADELCVTEGAVSKHIKALEAELRTKLFTRVSRRNLSTPAGEKLYQETRSAFALLRQAEQSFSHDLASKPFVLAAPSTSLLRVIIPNAHLIQETIGDRPLQFVADDTHRGTVDASYSLSLRIEEIPDVPNTLLKLADEEFGLVISPLLLSPETHDPARTLTRYNRLIPKDRPHIWESWAKESGVSLEPADNTIYFDEMYLVLQGAEASLGPTIAPRPLVTEAIENKRLYAPFGFHQRKGAYFVISPLETELDPDFHRVGSVLQGMFAPA